MAHKHTHTFSFCLAATSYIYNDTIDADLYLANLNTAHRTLPSDICTRETKLPRPVRTTLAQLHSGYCQQVNS